MRQRTKLLIEIPEDSDFNVATLVSKLRKTGLNVEIQGVINLMAGYHVPTNFQFKEEP